MANVSYPQKNEEMLYTEWVPMGRIVKVIILFVCILIISLGIVIIVLKPEELAFVGILFGIISLFITLIYWNFRGLKITLTNYQLDIRYGIFNRKKILLNNISSCDTTKAHFKIYGGVGIRLGLNGSIAYNTDFKEAIKLTFHSGRPLVFSTRNPQGLCNLIKEKMN